MRLNLAKLLSGAQQMSLFRLEKVRDSVFFRSKEFLVLEVSFPTGKFLASLIWDFSPNFPTEFSSLLGRRVGSQMRLNLAKLLSGAQQMSLFRLENTRDTCESGPKFVALFR